MWVRGRSESSSGGPISSRSEVNYLKRMCSFFFVSRLHVTWLVLGVVLLSSVILTCLTAQWQRQAHNDAEPLITTKQTLQRLLIHVPSHSPHPVQDFSHELPNSFRSQLAIDTFQHTAREAGVYVSSLSLRRAPARDDRLGRLEMTVLMQGAYPAVKQVLSDWLARFPFATLHSQQWRRVEPSSATMPGPAMVEAKWVLSIWTRPAGLDTVAKPAPDPSALAASAP